MDHSVIFSLIIQNTLLEVPRTVWFKIENYKLTTPTPLPAPFDLIWIRLPMGGCFSLLSMESILRVDMLEDRIMKAETRCKVVINTEAKVEENRELAKKTSSVTLVNTVLLEWGEWKSAWRGSRMLETGNTPAVLILSLTTDESSSSRSFRNRVGPRRPTTVSISARTFVL